MNYILERIGGGGDSVLMTEAINVLKLLVTLRIFDHMSKMSNIRVFYNKSRELIELKLKLLVPYCKTIFCSLNFCIVKLLNSFFKFLCFNTTAIFFFYSTKYTP